MDQEAIFCNACQVTVGLAEKNLHYNTEWHRYCFLFMLLCCGSIDAILAIDPCM